MATYALPSLALSPPVEPELWARLERLAQTIGCGVQELAAQALRDFVEDQEHQLTAIDAGIAEADAGELIDFADVKADVARKLAALSAKR